MHRLAKDNPKLYEYYPGLAKNPQRVRDLRAHRDLNDITFRKFKAMAAESGFRVEWFQPIGTRLSKIVSRVPLVRSSAVADICSTGAAAYLQKAGAARS
jgi:hypothetical protein